MSDNWVVQNLENALEIWNEKLAEIWQLLTQSPENFKGGTIWNVIKTITETVSWLCILGAAPFAAMGFVKYHGMTAEKFVIAWVRSEFLIPRRLTFKPKNLYREAMREAHAKAQKRH